MQTQNDILIVDDTPDNLRLLSTMLNERGYKVRPAPSGSHALATIKKKAPDLILLDVMMPELNGYEVCHALKADVSTNKIPIIFLSALNELEDKIKGFDVGGIDYITKPFHENEVMARVETHLKICNLQRKLQTETNRFKKLVEATFESIIIHSNGIIIDANPAAALLYRCNIEELQGAPLNQFIPQEFQNIFNTESTDPFEGSIIVKDEIKISVEVRTKSLHILNEKLNVTAMRDLTSEKAAEVERLRLLKENSTLKLKMKDRYRFGEILGRSPSMQTVYELISKASATDFPVMIHGESGTGKELVARTIHQLSNRKDEPFISVNSGAVTESLFEREFFGHRKGTFTGAIQDEPGFFGAANKGTLFLDEIGELPITMQVKLLRVLESGEYTPVGDIATKKTDIRIVAATNRNLDNLVKQGKFRQDLYYRIQVIDITLPPLRDRREDIRLLIEHILLQHNAEDRLTNLPEKLMEMIYHYDWPGNVRELKNILQRYLATDSIGQSGLTNSNIGQIQVTDGKLQNTIESMERKMIIDTLEKTGWHRSKTAERLGIPRRSLQRKMAKYELNSIE